MEESKHIRPGQPGYSEWKKAAVQQANNWHAHLTGEITTWGLETIKHIALVSLAGLAGAFVIVSGATDLCVKSSATTAALLFAIASGTCVAALYVAYLVRLISSNHQNKFIGILYRDAEWTDKDYYPPPISKYLGITADVLGWVAMVLVAIGGYILFNALG